jgi:hypothetical protein
MIVLGILILAIAIAWLSAPAFGLLAIGICTIIVGIVNVCESNHKTLWYIGPSEQRYDKAYFGWVTKEYTGEE